MKNRHLLFAISLYTLTLSSLFWGLSAAEAQNIGINTTGSTPDPSAMLDIEASDKGILIPRVALTATNAASPVTSPATGLLVYNTATAGTAPDNVVPGFYYWDGTMWVSFTNNTYNSTTTPTPGTIVATGVLTPADPNDFSGYVGGPSVPGCAHSLNLLNFYALFGRDVGSTYSTGNSINNAKGFKIYMKGFYQAASDDRINTSFESFGIGLTFTNGAVYGFAGQSAGNAVPNFFAHQTEGTRDNGPTIAAVIKPTTDASPEAILSYNSINNGDATYSAPTGSPTADLSAGIEWELILEHPSTATTINHFIITIKIAGNTVINEANPVYTGTITNSVFPVIMVNQDGYLSNCVYKIEKL